MDQKYIVITLLAALVLGIVIVLVSNRGKGKTWAEAITRLIYVFGGVVIIGEIVFLGPLLFKGGEDSEHGMIAIFLPIVTLLATTVAAMVAGFIVQIFEGSAKTSEK